MALTSSVTTRGAPSTMATGGATRPATDSNIGKNCTMTAASGETDAIGRLARFFFPELYPLQRRRASDPAACGVALRGKFPDTPLRARRRKRPPLFIHE